MQHNARGYVQTKFNQTWKRTISKECDKRWCKIMSNCYLARPHSSNESTDNKPNTLFVPRFVCCLSSFLHWNQWKIRKGGEKLINKSMIRYTIYNDNSWITKFQNPTLDTYPMIQFWFFFCFAPILTDACLEPECIVGSISFELRITTNRFKSIEHDRSQQHEIRRQTRVTSYFKSELNFCPLFIQKMCFAYILRSSWIVNASSALLNLSSITLTRIKWTSNTVDQVLLTKFLDIKLIGGAVRFVSLESISFRSQLEESGWENNRITCDWSWWAEVVSAKAPSSSAFCSTIFSKSIGQPSKICFSRNSIWAPCYSRSAETL